MSKNKEIKDLSETAAGGGSGGGATTASSIATNMSPIKSSMVSRQNFSEYLVTYYRKHSKPFKMKEVDVKTGTLKEYYELDNAVSKLKSMERSEVPTTSTVTYGVEDDEGNVMKITVKKEQSVEFEHRLGAELAEIENEKMHGETTKSSSLAELLFNLKNEFSIIDVEFPKIPSDVVYNADKASTGPDSNEMNMDSDMEGVDGMEGDQQDFGAEGDMGAMGGDDMAGMEGEGMDDEMVDDESVEDFEETPEVPGPESLMQSILAMLTANAEAEKAKADAAAEESKAKQAEYSAKAATATMAQQEELARLEVEVEEQKRKEKEAKKIADLAKYKANKSSMMMPEGFTSILKSLINEAIYTDEASWKEDMKEHGATTFEDTETRIVAKKDNGDILGAWSKEDKQGLTGLGKTDQADMSESIDLIIQETEQLLNEVDDGETVQSIQRQKALLNKKYAVIPGDQPDVVAYKRNMLQNEMNELMSREKAVRTRDARNAKIMQDERRNAAAEQNKNVQDQKANQAVNEAGNPQVAWNVYLNGKLIDTVSYNSDVKHAEVKKGLIDHDGYDSGIVVVKRDKQKMNESLNESAYRVINNLDADGLSNLLKGAGIKLPTGPRADMDLVNNNYESLRKLVIQAHSDGKISDDAINSEFDEEMKQSWSSR